MHDGSTPLMATTRLYNQRALPTLLHRCQLHMPPKRVLRCVDNAVMRMTGFPRYSVHPACLQSLRKIGLPIQFQDLRTASLATILRSSRSTVSEWLRYGSMLDDAFNKEGIRGNLLLHAWCGNRAAILRHKDLYTSGFLFHLRNAEDIAQASPLVDKSLLDA